MLKIVAIICFFVFSTQAWSATCSEIASQFAKDPNAISAEDLKTLKRCVDQKLHEKNPMQAPVMPQPLSPQQGKSWPNLPQPPKPPQQQ